MKFLLVITFLISLSFQAQSAKVQEGFPWPWSNQCEFEWASLKGNWQIQGESGSYYKIDVLEEEFFGQEVIMVLKYDSSGKVVAQGIGYKHEDSDRVQIAMKWLNETSTSGYWLQLAWTPQTKFSATRKRHKSCKSTENRYLAVKKTPFNQEQDEENPEVLEKMHP